MSRSEDLLKALVASGFNIEVYTPTKEGVEPSFPLNMDTADIETIRKYMVELTAWLGYLNSNTILTNLDLMEAKADMEYALADAYRLHSSKTKAELDQQYLEAKDRYYQIKTLSESYKLRIDKLQKYLETAKQLLIATLGELKDARETY